MSVLGKYFQTNIAVCVGDGKDSHYSKDRFYVSYAWRTLNGQKFIELFITEKGDPLEPLPYYAQCDRAKKFVESLTRDGLIKYMIQFVLNAKGISGLTVLL